MENTDGAQTTEKDRAVYRIEIHLFSGKAVTFDAVSFSMAMQDGVRTKIEWEFAPSMHKPGVQLPMLKLLNPNRIEYVTCTELPR